MRALVIGADGFTGRWLLRHLTDSGDRVTAVVGPRFRPPLDAAEATEQIDVRDRPAIVGAIARSNPDVVFDLAGLSEPGSRDDLQAAIDVSVFGSINALIGCASVTPPSRVLFVSTGYVYRGSRVPVDEASPTAPASVYAAAKLAAEGALLALAPAAGVDVVIARPFNHIGPGQADSFLVPTLARQLAAAEPRTSAQRVRVADPSIVRDFTDVRDVVRAYRLLAQRANPGEVFNVASGTGVSVEELARRLAHHSGVNATIERSGGATRADEPPGLVGSAARLEALGWRRFHSLDETLRDVLRQHAASSASA
jgi:GDP-4-dehydro-6-deoxy-D-mannose reductase